MTSEHYFNCSEHNEVIDSTQESKDDSIYHIIQVYFVRLNKSKQHCSTPIKKSRSSNGGCDVCKRECNRNDAKDEIESCKISAVSCAIRAVLVAALENLNKCAKGL